eukprot:11228329-Lingulodinium_polyedra.AAC.1
MRRPGQQLGEPLAERLGTPRGRHAQAGRRVWSGRPSRAPPLCFWPTIESERQHGDNGDAEHLAGHVTHVHVVEHRGGRGASGHPHHEHVRVAGQYAVVLERVPQGVTAYGAQRAPGPPLHRLREVRPEALCDLAQRGAGVRVAACGEGHVEDVRLARGQLEPEAAG